MSKDTYRNITNIIVTGKSGAGKQPRIDVLKDEFELDQLSTGDIFRKYLRIFNEYGYKKSLSDFWDTEKNTFIPDDIIARKLSNNDKDIILGLKAKYFVDKGLFVPDSITNALFEAAFSEKKYQKQILDGYPRTLDQAVFLIDLVKKQGSSIDFIILVDNSDDRIISRTVQRRICPNCGKVYHLTYKPAKDGKCEACHVDVIQRSDDTEEKIKSRLNEFQEKAVPAINYLKEQGIPVLTVPGHLESFTMENVRKSVMEQIEKLYAAP